MQDTIVGWTWICYEFSKDVLARKWRGYELFKRLRTTQFPVVIASSGNPRRIYVNREDPKYAEKIEKIRKIISDQSSEVDVLQEEVWMSQRDS